MRERRRGAVGERKVERGRQERKRWKEAREEMRAGRERD